MKVFWAWQSDHPRRIAKNVIQAAIEAAIEELKEAKDVFEAPEESREDLRIDHDTKGLTGSPDVARSILEKIQDCMVFVGDLTPVGKSPDTVKDGVTKPGRPLMNPNVAIEYGFALRKLTDSAVIGVLNEHYGEPEDLPFDIIHKRWPLRYRLAPDAKAQEIEKQLNHLKRQFVTALEGFLEKAEIEQPAFPEIKPKMGKCYFFQAGETLGCANRFDGGDVQMPYRKVLYMRLTPTKELPRPIPHKRLLESSYKYGAMGLHDEESFGIENDYGAICFLPREKRYASALTQYFTNGEVWALNGEVFIQGERDQSGSWYLVNAAEQSFMQTLNNGFKYMKEVGVQLPIKVIAGVTGMKWLTVVVSGSILGAHDRMMTDEVEVTRIFRDDSLQAQNKFLLELFKKIFDQSGHERPKHLGPYLNQ